MRFQLPQFVDIEDKILGPLTLKQFLIYIGGIFVLIPVYSVADMSLFVTIAVPVLGLTALFAHFRLNGKSLFHVIQNAVGFYTRGQLLIWQRTGREKLLRLEGGATGTSWSAFAASQSSLAKMAQTLETQGSVVNEEAEDILGAVKA